MIRKIDFVLKADECTDIQASLLLAKAKKFSGILTTIVSDNLKFSPIENETPQCLTRSPLVLNAWQWQENVIPIIKFNSQLGSIKKHIKEYTENEIIKKLQLAVYLKAGGIIYVDPVDCDVETLGKFLRELLSKKAFKEIKFIVQINLFDTVNSSNMYRDDITDEERDVEIDSWTFWNEFHKITDYSNQIEVALVINSNLPSDDTSIYRWLGESIAMIVIPHNTYTSNKSHFPVLTKRHQTVVQNFLQYATNCVVIEPKSLLDHRIEFYLDYIVHQSSFLEYNDHYNERDTLRIPLQPLYDNLDNNTYEVFERDPAKYILYQRAIEAALIDMVTDEEKDSKTVILMIVGCGRGPLIRSALNASENTKRKLKILAVEKNPGPIVLLMSMLRDLWVDKDITLISSDMRKIKLEEKVDILVSELMGSFGDNELSPECLDGVQHLLKPTGISIPQNSISYLQPVMNKQVYRQLQKKIIDGKLPAKAEFNEYTEINWLSYMSSVFHIDESKELFTFVHPNKEVPIDNSRYGKILFKSSVDCILHGFAGYFTSKLYKDIEISILPTTHTKGMGSWYSMFFPISKPIQLKQGDNIEVEFWRKVDTKKVWYEWNIVKSELGVHNSEGVVHPIYL